MSVTTPQPELDFLPLYGDQDEPTILARWVDWANEGLDPLADADQWVDTREGSHWRMVLTPALREFARVYDLISTEVPMSGFVLWAWELYLDDLAAAYNVQRNPATPATGTVTFEGVAGTDIGPGTTVGVAPSSATDTPPTFATVADATIGVGGTVDVQVQATVPGKAGDVDAGAITVPITPLPGITFTNAAPTLGGEDPESDDSLRTRVLQALLGRGPGNVQDYVRWAGAWPGVGKVSVVPVYNGAGTVLVMVSDPNGQPLPTAIVNALQADLDPIPGKGSGTAPVGAAVTTTTSTLLNIAVDATLTFLPGYTWDGAGGTIAAGPAIQAAIVKYFLSVPPGGTVRIAHVAGLIATGAGIDNATNVLLNSGSVDIAVSLTPARVPVLSTFTPH